MSNNEYPAPEQLDLPEPDEVSPDQEYYLGWLVQHNRLWVTLVVLAVILAISLVANVVQVGKYQPTVKYVTLQGGYPVVWNGQEQITIDSQEYSPARLQSVVRSFITNRYEYNWQNPQKINSALRLMGAEARQEEMQKLQDFNLRTSVIAPQLKVELRMEWSNMQVVARGDGRFEVSVDGEISITDAVRNTNPQHPEVRPVTLRLGVQAVEPTETTPLGYQIVATGRGVL